MSSADRVGGRPGGRCWRCGNRRRRSVSPPLSVEFRPPAGGSRTIFCASAQM